MRRVVVATTAPALVGGGAAAAIGIVAGFRGEGTAVTPAGQRVSPAGDKTTPGDLPLNSALSPDGKSLPVTSNGQGASPCYWWIGRTMKCALS